jgi:uncharacterized damage-inducible protein DinB
MTYRYSMFAAYNAWCNERLYDAVAQVSDANYRADRGAFFKSLHGTLNHLLVGDRIWMQRFTTQGEAPLTLDAILYDDFAQLRAARRAEDERISRYISSLNEADLAVHADSSARRKVARRGAYSSSPVVPRVWRGVALGPRHTCFRVPNRHLLLPTTLPTPKPRRCAARHQ